MPNYNDNPNMVPLMRMSPYSGYQKPVSKYARPANAEPIKRMEDLNKGQRALAKSGDEGITAVANMTGKTEEEVKAGISRKMKFCGGMSKPYGKKK
ncbi:MAG: hypothetical protein DWQ49_13375 [Bacteroidetes bacterium]|nr:MAG: hypothetical protein DWQ49_13375 [Bacteroidota bacterium]